MENNPSVLETLSQKSGITLERLNELRQNPQPPGVGMTFEETEKLSAAMMDLSEKDFSLLESFVVS